MKLMKIHIAASSDELFLSIEINCLNRYRRITLTRVLSGYEKDGFCQNLRFCPLTKLSQLILVPDQEYFLILGDVARKGFLDFQMFLPFARAKH